MIPKILHFCWFGGNEYPDIVRKCMQSWKENCPEYEIKMWNEENFDVNQCDYVREAYEQQKWAFVSDYTRIKVLYDMGGIYVDTDVEILKSLNDLLGNYAFMGFEHGLGVNSGLIVGSEAKHPFLAELLEKYKNIHFIDSSGKLNLTTCVEYTTNSLIKHGLIKENKFQKVAGVKIYPIKYFCPQNQFTGKVNLTEEAYTLHHYIGTWAEETVKFGKQLKKECMDRYGRQLGNIVYFLSYSVYVVKHDGLISLLKKALRMLKILCMKEEK